MAKKTLQYLFIILTLITFVGCNSNSSEQTDEVELTVSIAASLTDVMNEAKAEFQKYHPNIKINFNVGGSGTLAHQIQQGAPVDIFVSAAPDKMDQLEENNVILSDSRKNLLSNQMVLITQPNMQLDRNESKPFQILTSPTIQHIAIGEPKTVPAGQYAKEVLEHEKLWSLIQTKLVPAKDVRQVLTYVETGNAEAGIVYLSDALHNKKIKIVTKVNPEWHTPIIYPIAIIRDSKFTKESQTFIDFLFSLKGQEIITKYGFVPNPS